MFGKKKEDAASTNKKEKITATPLKPFSHKGLHVASKPPTSASDQPSAPRRIPATPPLR